MKTIESGVRETALHTETEVKELLLLLLLLLLFSYHRLFLPGCSLKPAVIPTAQASSFTLQCFPYYV
jgi:hypothetical protein